MHTHNSRIANSAEQRNRKQFEYKHRDFRPFRSGEFVIRQQGVLGFVIRQMRDYILNRIENAYTQNSRIANSAELRKFF